MALQDNVINKKIKRFDVDDRTMCRSIRHIRIGAKKDPGNLSKVPLTEFVCNSSVRGEPRPEGHVHC
jgi:hypothetical protein